MNAQRIILALLLFVGFPTGSLWGQAGNLPKGVGLYQYGYRSYFEQTSEYNSSGEKVPLGSGFGKDFSEANMLTGSLGQDLKKLSSVLKDFSGSAANGNRAVAPLYLGRLSTETQAETSVQIFALAYGITDRWAGFIGIPYVSAKVTSTLHVDGSNNALQVKEQLGDLAFEELKTGLDRASRLSVSEVQADLQAKGYEPLGTWNHSGVGDIRTGARSSQQFSLGQGWKYSYTAIPGLDLPTGHTDDPKILNDVNIGKGYYSINYGMIHGLALSDFLRLGIDHLYAVNLSTDRTKRVPVDTESLTGEERTTKTHLRPGDDYEIGSSIGTGWKWVSASYRLGKHQHFGDRYSGSLEGNYRILSDRSDSYQVFQEIGVVIDSTKAYQRGKFAVPFIAAVKVHVPIEAQNTYDERYIELSLSSFFKTPAAESTTKTH